MAQAEKQAQTLYELLVVTSAQGPMPLRTAEQMRNKTAYRSKTLKAEVSLARILGQDRSFHGVLALVYKCLKF